MIKPVKVHFQWRPQAGNPSDEMVVEAAVGGSADALGSVQSDGLPIGGERFRIPDLDAKRLFDAKCHVSRKSALELSKLDSAAPWAYDVSRLFHHIIPLAISIKPSVH